MKLFGEFRRLALAVTPGVRLNQWIERTPASRPK
jgi:hypothetical protein